MVVGARRWSDTRAAELKLGELTTRQILDRHVQPLLSGVQIAVAEVTPSNPARIVELER